MYDVFVYVTRRHDNIQIGFGTLADGLDEMFAFVAAFGYAFDGLVYNRL